jgi:Tfp pilus assembly protein PilF
MLFSLANVLQIEGLTALRPLMGAEGAAKAQEARVLFRRAHLLFPAQPLFLRNWAQLEFDLGERAAAYALLDQMEALAPASREPYAERVRMARQAGDGATVEATLARAAAHLGSQDEAQIRGLAADQVPGTGLGPRRGETP